MRPFKRVRGSIGADTVQNRFIHSLLVRNEFHFLQIRINIFNKIYYAVCTICNVRIYTRFKFVYLLYTHAYHTQRIIITYPVFSRFSFSAIPTLSPLPFCKIRNLYVIFFIALLYERHIVHHKSDKLFAGKKIHTYSEKYPANECDTMTYSEGAFREKKTRSNRLCIIKMCNACVYFRKTKIIPKF